MRDHKPDVLYLIRARISSGTMYGAPQLAKDVRVLKKAEAEIERLRAENAALKDVVNSERMARYLDKK